MNNMDFTASLSPGRKKEFKKICKLCRTRLSPERFLHSVRVAETASQLCQDFGMDTGAAIIAGIAHDLFKEEPQKRIDRWARLWDGGLFENLLPDGILAHLGHGPAAAAYLREKALITDNDILEAIACHSYGGVGIGPLAMVIYAADKLEPGRKSKRAEIRNDWKNGKYRKPNGLWELVLAIIESTVSHIQSKGLALAPGTMAFYNSLKEKIHP